MADVILVNEGKHPPGKIYSLIKSELCLYSSYLSSGIDMNYKKMFGNSQPPQCQVKCRIMCMAQTAKEPDN